MSDGAGVARDQRVYFFGAGKAEGHGQGKEILGGKGAGLAEMTILGVPVPPGFTINTNVCNEYYRAGKKLPAGLDAEVRAALAHVEQITEARFGDPQNPLLVSVRSGARVSMPGMMDTVLNLGLNDVTVAGLAARTKNPRFAWDSYRRFVAMYGDVVLGLKPESEKDADPFEELLEAKKKAEHVDKDLELDERALRELVAEFKAAIRTKRGVAFPEDPWEQLWGAVGAVFQSWENPRARTYRKLYGYPSEWGTAVTIQAMVFGNMGEDCATGVAFTRDPATGEKKFYGEFLINAQGEDVVAGIRTPRPIAELAHSFPHAYQELHAIQARLEAHFKDMQDIEFTIQRGKLWMLQTRNGKRAARAMVKIAVDMVGEGLIDRSTAILRQEPSKLDELLHPMIDGAAPRKVLARGLPASPGAAIGKIVFTANDAEARAAKGEAVILVRVETSPEDIHGMKAAAGILTSRGGMTCIAGETRVLTDRGLMSAETAFALFGEGVSLRILSFDSRTLQPAWRNLIAAGRKPGEVVSVAVSQTGRAEDNVLRLTADHKLFTIRQRRLEKKALDGVLADDDFVTVVDRVPALGETLVSPALAYVAGAILSDGHITLKPTKGSVTFVQKATPEKAEFIAAVEHAFLQCFGVPFSYLRERTTDGVLKGRPIHGSVEDRICFRRAPAAQLAEIRDNLVSWVLTLDRTALLNFLAGYVDGDGTFAVESSAVRLQISVAAAKPRHLEGVALACLRLGIVPQVTANRENFTLQIVEQVEEILAATHRVKAAIPARVYDSKCFAVTALFGDIVEQVNFMGRVREGIKRNLMFGASKIRRDILPLCAGEAYRQVEALLASALRSYRMKRVAGPEAAPVYNFEVEAVDELDKCFVVFSSRLTPVLVSNSHAAVVARGMGKSCVVGASSIHVDYQKGRVTVPPSAGGAEVVLREGDVIALDGSTGDVILGAVPLVPARLDDDFRTLMTWVDQVRTLKIRTNADTPIDARTARSFGAEGIGLCRTEHMFFEPDRILAVRQMILARDDDEAGRRAALAKILPMQRGDFEEIFRAMDGLPVTIRLLDPPLHEFLPQTDRDIAEVAASLGLPPAVIARRNQELHEANPMLGHRGCRLAVTHPEIYETQVRAIAEAARTVAAAGVQVHPEIMIPIVGIERELELLRALVERTFRAAAPAVAFTVGTMIELPRACVIADAIARHADFFSFGTNDLTQTTFGFSRDDIGHFLPAYLEQRLLTVDPFAVLDREGVGALMTLAIGKGRGVKPALKIGICGEHGGDPSSVEFCHGAGLDYVSCSPFRVPIARVAAARAALQSPPPGKGNPS